MVGYLGKLLTWNATRPSFCKQVKIDFQGDWRRPSWIWRSKHENNIEMMSPRKTPEMIYWKTGLTKTVKKSMILLFWFPSSNCQGARVEFRLYRLIAPTRLLASYRLQAMDHCTGSTAHCGERPLLMASLMLFDTSGTFKRWRASSVHE